MTQRKHQIREKIRTQAIMPGTPKSTEFRWQGKMEKIRTHPEQKKPAKIPKHLELMKHQEPMKHPEQKVHQRQPKHLLAPEIFCKIM